MITDIAAAHVAVSATVAQVIADNKPPLTVVATVDQLGDLNAEIAALQEKAKVYADFLKSLGPGEYRGERFKADVTKSDQDRINADLAREHLSKKMLAKITKTINIVSCTVRAFSAAKVA